MIRIDPDGYATRVEVVLSPNADERPAGVEVKLLVIHAISLPPGQFGGSGIVELFTNRLDPLQDPYYAEIAGLRVSAHFLIRRNGVILQFVSCDRRAWHAGISSWNGMERCNDFSIGIELEGSDDVAFEDAQYVALAALTKSLLDAYPIRGVAGHSHIAPGRKTDPGPFFDWKRFGADTGLEVAPGRGLTVNLDV